MGHQIIVQVEQFGPWGHAHMHRTEVGLGANQARTHTHAATTEQNS